MLQVGMLRLLLVPVSFLAAAAFSQEVHFLAESVKVCASERHAFEVLKSLGARCQFNEEGRVVDVLFPEHQVPRTTLTLLKTFPYLRSIVLRWGDGDFLKPLVDLKQLKVIEYAFDVPNQGLAPLQHLTKLEWIQADSPRISDKGLVFLGELKNLRMLFLNGARITDSGLVHLAGLAQLRDVRLNHTHISGSGLVHANHWERLKRLELNDTPLTDDGLLYVGRLTRLEELYLRGTKITDVGLGHLQGLRKLEVLDLAATGITSAGLRVFRMAGWRERMRYLDLSGTKISDDGMTELAVLSALKGLQLGTTSITDQGLLKLARLTNLTQLDVGETHVSCKGMAALWRRTSWRTGHGFPPPSDRYWRPIAEPAADPISPYTSPPAVPARY